MIRDLTTDLRILVTLTIIIRVFCPRAGPSLQAQEPRLQVCRRQVFNCKLRTQDCNFNRYWIGAVASRCFPHSTLHTLFSIWTDLKRSEKIPGAPTWWWGVDLANWALWTSRKFTTEVKYQFHRDFWADQRSGNHNHPSPPNWLFQLVIQALQCFFLQQWK